MGMEMDDGWEFENGKEPDLTGKTVLYLSGPMTGILHYNRPAFHSLEYALRQQGAAVLSPARLPAGMPENRYMPICMAMLDAADAVIMLPGWAGSAGAQVEYAYAKRQKKDIYYVVKREEGN